MNNMLTRRQAIAAGLGSAATLALAGCGSSSSSSAGSSSSSEAKDSYKVAMIMSNTITDNGWDQAHYESVQRALEAHPKWELLTPKEKTANTDAAAAAESYVDQDVDLIIGDGNQFASLWSALIGEVAENHPDVHFLITNTNPDSEMTDCEDTTNLMCVLPNFKQCGAMAGVVAGLMTQTKSIGFIAGAKLPSSLQKYSAFLAAAKKVGGDDIQGQVNFEAGFNDAAKGTQLAEQWINTNNVDVMWGDASSVDAGVRQALETAGVDTHFDIAQPIDILGDDQPSVIASTVTDWMISQAMDEVEAGTFGGGKTLTADVANGGLSYGKFSDKVDADKQAQIEEYLKQIESDELITDEEIEAIQSTL